jgi:hypothetical protein
MEFAEQDDGLFVKEGGGKKRMLEDGDDETEKNKKTGTYS